MNDSTVTLNGTAVMFAASPSAGQVQIGSTLAATLQNLHAALEAFTDANIMLMEYFANASNLYVEALAGSAAGNALVAVCDGLVEVSEESFAGLDGFLNVKE
jgi:hypothetical protein